MRNIAIVLTGTIVPQAKYVKYRNYEKRRQEYLANLRYYSQFAPVFFLENSGYDIQADADFTSIANITYRSFKADNEYEQDIGYQEFSMLDTWEKTEPNMPEAWFKISGRYRIENFAQLFAQCSSGKYDIVIEMNELMRWADTYLFFCSTTFYRSAIEGLYRYCGPYSSIEQIIFNYLIARDRRSFMTIFVVAPAYQVTRGGTGVVVCNGLGFAERYLARPINYRLHPTGILYPSASKIVDKIKKILLDAI